MRPVTIKALFFASVMWIAASSAQATTDTEEPPCMECHKPRDVTIDPVQYAHSVHGGLDCSICHSEGFNKFPHGSTRANMPDCKDCHSGPATPPIDFDKIAAAVKASIHTKVDPTFRCTNCHSPHKFVPAGRFKDVSETISVSNQGCLSCHAGGETAALQQIAYKNLVEKHRLFPHHELHIQRNACVACHTPAKQQTVHLILAKSEALKDCSTCHTQNSVLVTKLYAHLAINEGGDHGWINAVLFNSAYLTGATRNRWLDWGTLVLAGLTIFGVAVHGLGRWAVPHLRRKQ